MPLFRNYGRSTVEQTGCSSIALWTRTLPSSVSLCAAEASHALVEYPSGTASSKPMASSLPQERPYATALLPSLCPVACRTCFAPIGPASKGLQTCGR